MLIEQQQRVIADRLEMAVVGAALLLAVDEAIRGVHVEYDALGGCVQVSPQHERAYLDHLKDRGQSITEREVLKAECGRGLEQCREGSEQYQQQVVHRLKG